MTLKRPQHFVFLGLTTFDSLPQREHALARQLANDGHNVDFIEIPPSSAGRIRTFLDRLFSPVSMQNGFSYNGIPENLRIHTPPMVPTAVRNSLTPALDRWLFRKWFKRTFPRDSLADAIVMVMFPMWWKWYVDKSFLGARCIIYDIADALDIQGTSRKVLHKLEIAEAGLKDEVDVITYSAYEMRAEIEEKFPGIHSVRLPNAVSASFFNGAKRNGNHPRPGHIGFIGMMNSRWVDTELIEQIIRKFPECTVSLIGPVESRFVRRYKKYRNLKLHGFVHHEALPHYLSRMDVAIIPFQRNNITRVVNPLKVYEYCTAGVPVVASWTEELEHMRDVVYLAHDEEQFLEKIDVALREENLALRQKRRAYAEKNSWTARIRTLYNAIGDVCPDLRAKTGPSQSSDSIG
ncbi:MAG: glycosyltransferase family 1 protein [Chlorobi bacterium]|nr:glycosyltransferase family 1 protein [Chlorobiota bacterium]